MRCQSRSSCVLLAAFLVAAGSAGGVSAEDAAFGQFSTHTTNVNTLQTSPDGHELHFIQDANARIWEWHKDKEQYVPHDEDAHHHPDHGHHHKVMFNFESGNPPKELQKDEHGHPLIELFNQKVSSVKAAVAAVELHMRTVPHCPKRVLQLAPRR